MKPNRSHHAQPDEGSGTPRTESALAWLRGSGAQSELVGAVDQEVKRTCRRKVAGVGALALVLLVGGVSFTALQTRSVDGVRETAVQPTASVTAPRRQLLPDGSLVELRENAEIRPEFTAERRSVVLVRGEAHFQVKSDAARPFVVSAGSVAVRAVGTAFAVHHGGAVVEVLVTEGRVAVERPASPASAAAQSVATELKAGGKATVPMVETAVAEVSTLPEAELAKRLAWRVPQLEFSRTSLVEVVELMNRHGGGRVQIVAELPAAEMLEMKLSGFMGADNTDGLARLLSANFPVVAERDGATLRIRAKETAK